MQIFGGYFWDKANLLFAATEVESQPLGALGQSISPNFLKNLLELPKIFPAETVFFEKKAYLGKDIGICSNGRIITEILPTTVNGPKQRYPIRWHTYLGLIASRFRNQKTTIYKQAVFISAPFTENYYHFVADVLLRISAYQKASRKSGTSLTYLTSSTLTRFQREYFSLLGISVVRICKAYVECLWVCLPRRFGYVYSNRAVTELRQYVYDRLKLKDLVVDKKLYISRRKSKNRRVINENEILDNLHRQGFLAVDLEDLSVEDQIRRFASAKIVIGPHGAGLVNIIFSREPRLIELLPSDDFRWGHFASLCACAGGSYQNVLGKSKTSNDDFEVSWHVLALAVKEFERDNLR